MNRSLRILLAGAGRWGRVHARKLAGRHDAELAAIWDRDRERAAELAGEVGGDVVCEASEIPDDIDAAVIAVASDAHVEVALPLLERCIPLLVEKPLATDLDGLRRLEAAAADRTELLHAAMIERTNPAYTAVRSGIGAPLFIQVERLAAFSPRSLDTDVVLDLMIHDLDLVLDLAAGNVTETRAVGGPVLTGHPDMAHVRLEFDSGCVAVLASSRVSFEPVRTLRTFGPDGYHSLDLMHRTAHRAGRTRGPDGQLQLSAESVDVPAGDALELQQGLARIAERLELLEQRLESD